VIVGMTRVRNEALILEDTLTHVLRHVDSVVLYDDASTDRTLEIARSFDRVRVIAGEVWNPDQKTAETVHRARALAVVHRMRPEWCWCFDADERLTAPLPVRDDAEGVRLRLYDGYMAPGYEAPYTEGPLIHLRRLWGPEVREILMLFRPDRAAFRGAGQREPKISGRVVTSPVRVRHYGKCLSVEHWEDTCDFYARYFPEPFKSKWDARRGRAIHTMSDFGRPLHTWDDLPCS
jgi:hypothetical protein